ncbi:MAG: hypothetical protein A3B34_01085 [Candidatus Sungbacteria bacterium RIFCSPLOWO2_01_FULL_54_21]|uniref:WD40 repeat domain-containing protein n=1 Tax=Candidatus Sungbacteria bacterium RIFCSPLOWO2_01_FULL_54_21 TaxID=1802279 RepID=A0A1G2L9R8_9BACT|nr:MAG: hypothetical protein A3B34_01085 [Candidatus Sungbacteria bacterium RIFCSPLOWO2_01_FULL_54_21]
MTPSRTKRTIFILLGIVALGVLLYLAYRALQPTTPASDEGGRTIVGGSLPSPAIPQTPAGSDTEGATPLPDLPSIAEDRLVRLTDYPVVSPVLNKDETRVLFYKKSGGDLFASDFTGKIQEKQTNLTIIGLIEAIWQRGGSRGMVRYTDGAVVKAFLQIGTSTIAVLPQGITSASWSPDGSALAYTIPRDGQLELVVTDATGKSPRTLSSTPLADASMVWITADLFAFATAPSATAEGYFFAFSRRDGSLVKTFGPQRGLMGLWSPDGATALASGIPAGARETGLTLYDRQKKESSSLALSTLAEKCVWSDVASLFCAVPKEIPPGTPLPDAYLSGVFNPSDRIVSIDRATRAVTPIFDEGDFDMANILATKDKKRLFFVSRRDGTLWTLKLP